MKSAEALAHKKDDRLRKEFEKWAVLTYSNSRAIINDKKGGDKGIDGTAYFLTDKDSNAKVVFQVKSGGVGRGDISKFNNDRAREGAEIGVFLTLQPPTQGMIDEVNAAGIYEHKLMGRSYNTIQIVTIKEIIEGNKRLEMPLTHIVLKEAEKHTASEQLLLESTEDIE
jgi:site-specific DNA-methyltransferase (adenine-specific)